MYLVLVYSKLKEPLSDLMPTLTIMFPHEMFSIHGSDEKGYKLHIEKGSKLHAAGHGDEKPPRAFAEKFLKKWIAKPTTEEETKVKLDNIFPNETEEEIK